MRRPRLAQGDGGSGKLERDEVAVTLIQLGYGFQQFLPDVPAGRDDLRRRIGTGVIGQALERQPAAAAQGAQIIVHGVARIR